MPRRLVDVSSYVPSSGSAFMSSVDAVSGAAYLPSTRDRVNAFISDPADALGDYLSSRDNSDSGLDPNGVDWIGYYSGSASGSTPSTPQQLQYIDAPYATMYGMDASTAYQEALANTAYQRKVKDLQAAGLNPVLGISGSGASDFRGYGASMSGGVSYGSVGSGKTTSDLSDTLSKLSYGLPYVIGGLVSASTKNPSAGNSAYMISSGLGNIIRNFT